MVFLPNVQLTFLLLILYSKKLKFCDTLIIGFSYVILDNLIAGSFNILFMIFITIGLLIIPILLNTLFKKVESHISLAILGILFSFIYSWLLIIPGSILFEIDFINYLKADIIWEIILAISSFITILFLYKPCAKILDANNLE